MTRSRFNECLPRRVRFAVQRADPRNATAESYPSATRHPWTELQTDWPQTSWSTSGGRTDVRAATLLARRSVHYNLTAQRVQFGEPRVDPVEGGVDDLIERKPTDCIRIRSTVSGLRVGEAFLGNERRRRVDDPDTHRQHPDPGTGIAERCLVGMSPAFPHDGPGRLMVVLAAPLRRDANREQRRPDDQPAS